MKVYIAGPVAGIPDNNKPAFDDAAGMYRAFGEEVVNPLDLGPDSHDGPCPTTYNAGQGADHDAACYMRTDIAALLTCDAIQLLPGWEASRGALAEWTVARAIGLQIYYPNLRRPATYTRALDDIAAERQAQDPEEDQ